MKKYKLLNCYPSLPSLKVGDVVKKLNSRNLYVHSATGTTVSARQVEQYPEFWEKVKEKNYEILEVIGNNTGNIYIYNGVKNIGNGILNFSIYSVKRLSDGEVFTVGDYIASTKGFEAKIEKFKIANNFVYVYGKGMGNPTTIMQIRHKEREPIFTTEDGVDIYEGDEYYNVHKEHMCVCYNSGAGVRSGTDKDRKYFSTEEKAKEYVDLHKPQYSEKDIERAYKKLSSVCVLGSPFLRVNFLTLINELKNGK